MLQEARCAYIIIIMAVYWCTEVIPLAVTSLMPVVFFPLLGVQSSKSVCLQYLNDTTMLFVGGLIVAISVEQWNLHKRIALRVLLILGVKPALLMLGFMIVTAFLSMWISNTATTAMMVPIVQAVLDQMDNTEYDVTMMEQATGQTNTVIELEEKNASDPSSVHVISNGQVPDDPRSSEEKKMRKRVCKGMTLCVCYAASIGGTATLTGTGPNMVLKGQMNQLYPNNNDIVNFASWFGFAFPNMILMLVLAWLWLQCSFMGLNFKKSWGCGTERTAKEKAAYNVLKAEMKKLGPISYAEFNVLLMFVLLVLLWFSRHPGFVKGWAARLFPEGEKYITDSAPAVFIALLLFILPANKPKFIGWNPSMSDPEQTEEELWALSLAGSSNDSTRIYPTMGHCNGTFTYYRSLHRMHQQCCHSHPLPPCLLIHGCICQDPPLVCYAARHSQRFLCLHVTCCNTAERDRVLLRPHPCFGYG
ncbi:solute carrier family 13 member 5 isoform X2 [Athene cunicularia]|uniref:solute carrier family 13 member 5 isoform X2 n=1 Tax=Athene cunicularia TaxID=194338 RepID=UPI000EF752F8|nr:solute carrier family 13 member 5 isoform X2 [Athene cunicularia]